MSDTPAIDKPADKPEPNGNGYSSRKLLISFSLVFAGFIAATIFAFIVGKTDPKTLAWIGRLTADQWIRVFEFCCYVVMIYVGGNVAQGGVAALKSILTKK